MPIEVDQYVPLLKWRQGEYQALLRLDKAIQGRIVPLIVVPPVEYDFEDECDKKTVEEHLEPFARRYKAKWNKRPALIDVHDSLEIATRDSGLSVIASIFDELRANLANGIPVINVNRTNQFLDDVKAIQKKDDSGIGLRVTLSDLMRATFAKDLSAVLARVSISREAIDLILDLGAPENFEPYRDFAKVVASLVLPLGDRKHFRSFAVVATSFPESQSVRKPGGSFVRHEWGLYKALIAELPAEGRTPTFGDYGMERPEFLQMDMRLIKPAGKLVYTTPTGWLIRKGGAFRDDPAQMVKHCKDVLKSGDYRGETYSSGDKYIKDCAAGTVSTSNLSRWKSVGMNHHMTQIVEDISKYHGS